MRLLRDHGMSRERKYYHEVIGYNYRMTNMQAAIGVAQMEHIEEILEWRHLLEENYRKVFSGITGIQMQSNNLKNRKKITWLVSILVKEDKRDAVLEKLKDNNIDCRPFFTPLSEMKIYRKYAQNCRVSKRISQKGLNLPTTYEMDEGEMDRIVQFQINTSTINQIHQFLQHFFSRLNHITNLANDDRISFKTCHYI